jgi:cytochrome b
VALPGLDPASLQPYAKETYDEAAYEAMRAFRKPFIVVHYYGFYTLLVFALVHILAVVKVELGGGGDLVSAMVSGKKVLSGTPADETRPD